MYVKRLSECINEFLALVLSVNRTDVQLKELTKMQPPATSQADVVCVQERIKTLEIAMQIAREVRRIPFLEQYCTLDKVGNLTLILKHVIIY